MNTICAYFDTQGFPIDGVSHPREICLLNDYLTLNFIVDKEEECVPTEKEELQIEHLTNKFHGLDCFPKRAINDEYLRTIIKLFHEFSKIGRKNTIAVKSKEAEDYLFKLNIPTVNILTLYGASHKEINRNQIPCNFHNRDDPLLKCSLKISQDMKSFIDNLQLGPVEHD